MAYRLSVSVNDGKHRVVSPRPVYYRHQLPVYHFKWVKGVDQRLFATAAQANQKKLDARKNVKHGQGSASNMLEYVRSNDRICLECPQFKGVCCHYDEGGASTHPATPESLMAGCDVSRLPLHMSWGGLHDIEPPWNITHRRPHRLHTVHSLG
jgi:hypothetical protein